MKRMIVPLVAASFVLVACHDSVEPTPDKTFHRWDGDSDGVPEYVAVDLGVPGEGTNAWGINDRGQIVGTMRTEPGVLQDGFLWDNGTVTPLGTLGGNATLARDINNWGQVVGVSRREGSGMRWPFIWSDGVMTELPVSEATFWSDAWAINLRGMAVGRIREDVGGDEPHIHWKPVLWENGEYRFLTDEHYGYIGAYDINLWGVVVGDGQLGPEGEYVGWMWKNEELEVLPTLGEEIVDAWCNGINNLGQMVGASVNDDGIRHAVMWERGGIRDLGVLPGQEESMAWRINDRGQVVGCSGDQAFLWHRGTMISLSNAAGGAPGCAQDINLWGVAVGYITQDDGLSHATMWLPRSMVDDDDDDDDDGDGDD